MQRVTKIGNTLIHFLNKYKWYLLGVVYVALFISHIYWDMVVTVRFSLNFMDSIFTGNLRDFYLNNVETTFNNPLFHSATAMYDIPIYLLMGIWNLPLYFLEKIGVDIFANSIYLLWNKLFLLVVLLAAVYMVVRILRLFDIPKKQQEWCCFAMLSSTLVLAPILIMAQCDILCVLFMLMGLEALIRQKNNWFVAFFAIAFSFKGFALFVFLPLLLLREKRIPRILLGAVLAILPTFVLRLLIPFSDKGKAVAMGMYMSMTRWEIPSGVGMGAMFFVLWFAILAWCYLRKENGGESLSPEGKKASTLPIYICFVSLAAFIACVTQHPYWMLLLAPFLS